MSSFAALRNHQQIIWRQQLMKSLRDLVQTHAPEDGCPDQVWLFGSRARCDRDRWQALPTHASPIWRAVAQEALPLLAEDPPGGEQSS